jgi:hypothetical protein
MQLIKKLGIKYLADDDDELPGRQRVVSRARHADRQTNRSTAETTTSAEYGNLVLGFWCACFDGQYFKLFS